MTYHQWSRKHHDREHCDGEASASVIEHVREDRSHYCQWASAHKPCEKSTDKYGLEILSNSNGDIENGESE
jgi:hypothetical protein